MMTIRRLDPRTDAHLFAETYSWLLTAPRWRRDAEAVFGTLDREEYLLATYAPGRIDIGVFDDSDLRADIILTLVGHNIYEVHLEAARTAPWDIIELAGTQVRDQMFQYGMELAFTWQPSINRAVAAIEKAIGFTPDHVTMLRGESHGKLLEWQRYSLRRP